MQPRQNLELSKEDWIDWLHYPQTVEFFKQVKSEQEDLFLYLVKREGAAPEDQAKLLGVLNGLQKVLEFGHDIRDDE